MLQEPEPLLFLEGLGSLLIDVLSLLNGQILHYILILLIELDLEQVLIQLELSYLPQFDVMVDIKLVLQLLFRDAAHSNDVPCRNSHYSLLGTLV